MICPMCGMVLPDGAKFCFECGEKVVDVPAGKKLEEPIESTPAPAASAQPATPPRATPYYPRSTSRSRVARATYGSSDVERRVPSPDTPAQQPRRADAAASVANPVPKAESTSVLSSSAVQRGTLPGAAPSSGARRTAGAPARRASGTIPTEPDPFTYNPATDTSPEPGPAAQDGSSSSRFVVIPASGNGQEAFRLSRDPERSTASKVVVGIVTAVVVVAVVGVLGYATFGWFGPSTWFSSEDDEETSSDATTDDTSDGDTATVLVVPDAQEDVESYSWEELSQIADLIAAAEDDEAGLEIAIEYNLCLEDGTLDGTQTKTLELEDGTEVTVRIVGFRADTRSDGSGVAGITFVATTSVGEVTMNSDGSTEGGWGASELREWMNGELLELLPDDLAEVVVAVDKVTNPSASEDDSDTDSDSDSDADSDADSTSEQETTSDTLWVLSYSEVAGEVTSGSRYGYYVSEGEQYQLFADMGVTYKGTFDILATTIDAEASWLRTPDCLSDIRFLVVLDDGTLGWAYRPENYLSVLMGFCL